LFPVSFGASNNAIIKIDLVLLFTLHNTKTIAYHITEVLIFYADKLVVMGNSKNLRVFNFAILLKLRKFDAHEIYMFYSITAMEQFAGTVAYICWLLLRA